MAELNYLIDKLPETEQFKLLNELNLHSAPPSK